MKINKLFSKNKKQFIRSILYVIIIGTYIFISVNLNIKWENNLENWRKKSIRDSPIVCITKTGEKYHNCYHYNDRNKEITLFEANEMGFLPCHTCNPPVIKNLTVVNNEPKFYFRHWLFLSIVFVFLSEIFLSKFFPSITTSY